MTKYPQTSWSHLKPNGIRPPWSKAWSIKQSEFLNKICSITLNQCIFTRTMFFPLTTMLFLYVMWGSSIKPRYLEQRWNWENTDVITLKWCLAGGSTVALRALHICVKEVISSLVCRQAGRDSPPRPMLVTSWDPQSATDYNQVLWPATH